MTKDIVHNWTFPQPPETVWDYLTNSELLTQWLMKNDIKPIPGHQFTFRTPAMPNMAFDGIVYCEITELVAAQKLSYTWKGGPGDGTINLDTVVTWILERDGAGTKLQLVHSGFKDDENAVAYTIMNQGWGDHIKARLSKLLNEKHHEAV